MLTSVEKTLTVWYNRNGDTMIDKKEAPLLDDYIFKRTFTRDNPNGILRDFLEAVLNIQIRNVQVLNSEIPKDLI